MVHTGGMAGQASMTPLSLMEGSARIIRDEEDVPDKWGILDTPLGLVVEKEKESDSCTVL